MATEQYILSVKGACSFSYLYCARSVPRVSAPISAHTQSQKERWQRPFARPALNWSFNGTLARFVLSTASGQMEKNKTAADQPFNRLGARTLFSEARVSAAQRSIRRTQKTYTTRVPQIERHGGTNESSISRTNKGCKLNWPSARIVKDDDFQKNPNDKTMVINKTQQDHYLFNNTETVNWASWCASNLNEY